MRDPDPLAPEILETGHEPAGDFAEVALARGGDVQRFRFGVSAQGKSVLQRVLATRPFDTMSGLTYRYYYAGQGGRGDPVTHLLYVRVEQGRQAHTVEFEAPADLVGVLDWFRRLPDFEPAVHLRAAI
jgi:hypothetical protein